MPHPSPVVPSAPIAPLCANLSKAVIAVLISQWLGLLSIFAIKPKPQLSFSKLFEHLIL